MRIARNILTALVLLGLASHAALAERPADIARQHHQAEAGRIISDFREFLSIPNVASNVSDMMDNAAFIEAYIGRRGFTSKVVSAGGAPYVVAERPGSDDAPTVLVYAHFDGQPVIPSQWSSPPFEPTLWTDNPLKADAKILSWDQEAFDPSWRVVARSAGDDKAPVIALMAAIDALVAADKMPDVTVKLILDGEEERGSPTLAGVLDQIAGDLVADVMLFCDGPMHQSGRRQLVLGVRGSMTVDLTTFGPNRPLHSGHYGNWAPNPNEILMRLLLSLKDDEGRVVVEGYSDDVRAISAREATAVAAMPSVDAQMKHELGLGSNEIPDERLESAIMRPAIVVRGISGGGVGPEARNIIEPTAQASLNLRLVPGQKPEALLAALRAHFEKMGMTVSANGPSAGAAREHHLQMVPRPGGYRSFRTSIDANVVGDLKVILDRLGDQETLITPTMGGSLPIYLFEDNLDAPIVILPVANHDNNQHGRDENLRLKNLFDAIEMYAEVLVGLTDEP
jgi:acetylornithine deacetylase/succinyl-diaminopimelate desuccinylase-like protein